MGKRVMEVPGKRRRGRPKRGWLDNITNDLSERELSGEESQERIKWRRLIRNIDPTQKWEKDSEEEKNTKHQSYLCLAIRAPHWRFNHGGRGASDVCLGRFLPQLVGVMGGG